MMKGKSPGKDRPTYQAIPVTRQASVEVFHASVQCCERALDSSFAVMSTMGITRS